MKQFIAYSKSFLIIALVLVIIWMRNCSGDTLEPDYIKQNKELVEKVKKDSAARREDSIKNVVRFNSLKAEREYLKSKADKTEIIAYQQQGTINRLVTQLRASKEIPFDSSFVYVAPEYVENCDSLGDAALKQGELLERARKENEQVFEIMNYEIFIRDSVIDAEAGKYNELRNDFNAQTHYFNLAVRDAKRRVKGYVGVAAMGNLQQPIKGAEGSFALQMKNSDIFDLSVGGFNSKVTLPNGQIKTINDWYVEFGYKKLIKFR